MMRRALLLLIAVVGVAAPAAGQQWSTVQVITSADGDQQLILRSADGRDPRRISVSNLLAGTGSGASSGSGGDPVRSAAWDAGTYTLTLTLASGATRTVTIPQDTELAAQLAVERNRITGALSELQTVEAAVDALGDVQSVTVATIASYQSTLNSQFGSSEPLVLVIGADITGTFTHPSTGVSTTISWDSGDVLWLPPQSVSPEILFTLPDGPRDYGARATAVASDSVIGNAVQVSRTDHVHNLPLDPAQLTFDNAGQLTIAQSFINGLGSGGGGGGGGVEVVTVHAGNVAIGTNLVFVDAGFDWPAGVPWLLIQYNPAGRFSHREFTVVYNPRVGRWAGDTVGVAAAVVGDQANSANATGVDVVHSLTGSEPAFLSALLGVTSTGRALIASSNAAIDPTPLVVLAVVPSGGASTGSPGREFILQDALRTNADTVGVTTLQLPTDYEDYQYVEIVGRDSGAGEPSRSTGAITIPTAYLALQQDADNARFGLLSDENGNQQWLAWTLSTRTFVPGAEDGDASAVVRIVYARLYNSGITGVDIPQIPAADGDYVLSVAGETESWSAAPAAWPGDISFSPAAIAHGRGGAQTYEVFLHAEPGVYPTGAKFRASLGGNAGSLVTIDTVTPAASTVALNAAGAANLIASATRDGLARVDVLVYPASTTDASIGTATTLARLHNVIPFDSEGQWRSLRAIPDLTHVYSASLLDHSFKVQVNRSPLDNGVRALRGSVTIDVARVQMTPGTVFRVIVAENRPDALSPTELYVDLTLNAAGTQLTVALVPSGGNNWTAGHANFTQYSIGGVFGR